MSDIRLQRLAQVIVRYSLSLRKGDRLAIFTTPLASPLVNAVIEEALQVGAHPEPFIELPGVTELLLNKGSFEQLAYLSPLELMVYEEYEAHLFIFAQENTRTLTNIQPDRLAYWHKARERFLHTRINRHTNGSLRWHITMFPTAGYAQDTNMSTSDFEDFVYRACFLDEDDPIACWQEIQRLHQRLISWLAGKKTVHLLGPDTDLTFSIAGRPFISEDAHLNLPGGEIYTSPVEDSMNGMIRYPFPVSFKHHFVEDIRLRFKDGVVVEATAARGQDFLERMLGMDEGARRVGEFAIGTNTRVDRCTGSILFDEKMGGTIHIALGANVGDAGGTNQSALHWDMICDLRTQSEIRVDGELFSKDGQFLIPE